METKACERAHSICLHYLESNIRYSLIHQLNDIGSRVDKYWFVVRDSSVKTERLLSVVPKTVKCPIRCDSESRSVILDLFLALQHPYIYPILDINFRDVGDNCYIFTTLPLNDKGSLKDFIYKSRWEDNWGQKYFHKSNGLPMSQIQRLGRQILEALLFLREKGFPSCGHFHTGNIVLQNGVARLSGLENALFGFNSRICPVLLPRAHSEPESIDSLCFGHVLFEMCAGYELDTSQPSAGNLLDIHQYPQVVEVLELIFEHPDMRLPVIEEILLCDLFRNIDLREIRNQAQSTHRNYYKKLKN
ncbi:Slowpoke-binding protein, putative [Pediculus humanus corporis]|uniref:Slowpoke-binding protein, putative n=1 Tax=Pediculus humanus subsp. corporis TaxID=121224 RepID=E0VDX1_PEDHC|nr:Slowpoke-binding protein, putative [Pediculus humanus corporis]EEB11577.1 Slowpoke-binding protein, putative [Pediculus humanus corporis]